MLEWVCPRCQRDVPAGQQVCPFCKEEGGAPAASATKPLPRSGPRPGAQPSSARAGFAWADVERGFRFGLGLVAALAVSFFVLYLSAYFGGWDDLAERLARLIRFR